MTKIKERLNGQLKVPNSERSEAMIICGDQALDEALKYISEHESEMPLLEPLILDEAPQNGEDYGSRLEESPARISE